MSKKNDLLKNTLVLAIGKFSTQLISFLLLPIYTIYLDPQEYGTVDLIVTYATLIAPMITLHLEMAAFRFLIEARNDERKRRLVISIIITTVSKLLAGLCLLWLIVSSFIHIPNATLIFLVVCTTIISNLFMQFARGVGDNRQFVLASTFAAITTLVANILFVIIFHIGLEGVLIGMTLANAVAGTYLFLALKLHRYINLSVKNTPLRNDLLGYSLPLVPNSISLWIVSASDRTIISTAIGIAANGIYAASNKYALIFTSIFSIFGMSWTESASVHINSKDRDSFFSATYNASIRLFGSLGLILIAYMPLIFNVLIGAKYSEAYLYIPILIVSVFFSAIVSLYGGIYIAKKLTKQVAYTTIISAVINISLCLAFINYIGIYAAAFSTMISYIMLSIYRHYDVKKYVNIKYQKYIFVKLLSIYVLAITLYYFNNIVLNIANAIVISVLAILLNRSIIKTLRQKLKSYTQAKI